MEAQRSPEANVLHILNTGSFMVRPLYHRTAGSGLFPGLILGSDNLALVTRGGHCFQKGTASKGKVFILGFTAIKKGCL
jgi:hypothetical protein